MDSSILKNYSTEQDLKLLSESALESSLAGFWDWDMVTNEEYLSPRFKEMFGYADDEMENKPESWQQIAFQEDLPLMFEQFNKHVESHGEVPFESIVRYHHKDGGTVWVRCNGKVVEWSDQGEPLRAIGCHIDITEEKELESQLKKAIKERDVLLKEVHHRVKNNLQLLLSLARLKDKKGVIETHEIEDSINSIAKAYEAIYQSSRIDDIDVREYIDQIVKPILNGQNVSFQIDCKNIHKNIEFLIPIGLIATELVNNSLKHAFHEVGEPAIAIEIFESEGLIYLNYHDNGNGYSDEVLSSIDKLDSFGMMIIQGLISQLNGEVKFYNKDGASTELKMKLS